MPKKYEPKKVTNLNSSNYQIKETNSKKKGSFDDEKKETVSNKKLNIFSEKLSSQE